ncbi:hypothetical protein [Acaryochloris marina]|uniref:hypothetical protein n=1 Tax=Acaryochloris marina TaxID=155978 RepID=UPI001BAF432F|nr:hypothetical protein [Acaryochloris marina]QUY45483.1 hypothetical protein I1H34_27300 [Acaryochloris marina S15]
MKHSMSILLLWLRYLVAMNPFISLEQTFLALARVGFSPLGVSGLSHLGMINSAMSAITPEIENPLALDTSVVQENQVITNAAVRDSVPLRISE